MHIRTADYISNKNIMTFLSLLALAAGIGIAIASFGFSILLFILLVCVGCYVLFNPWRGFLSTIFFLPFSGIPFERITGVDTIVMITPSQFFGMLALIGYLLGGKRLTFTRQDRALLVFFVIALFTSLINYPRILSVDIEFVGGIFRNSGGRCFAQLLGLGIMIAIYLLTVNILTTQQKLNSALKLFLGSMFITSIFAVYQFIGYFFGLPFVNFTYYPAVKEVVDAGIVGDFARAGSVAGEPKQLSYVLLSGIFIFLPLVVLKSHPFKSRVVPSIILFSIFAAFVFTFARSGWVSFIISFLAILFLMFFYKTKERLGKKLLVNLTLLVLLPVFFVVLNKIISWSGYSLSYWVIERFLSIEDTWNESYIESIYLNETWRLATSNFWWGVGFGNSSFYMSAKPFVDVTGTYLRLLSETGIFGLLTFLWFLSGNLIYSIKAMRNTPEEKNRVIILALVAGVLSLLINWVHYGQDFINPIIWVLLGMLKASAKLGYNMSERS